ncbi:hypothetical protein EYF80_046803 [Liparis tanakae]|uniref:Uncharacterized protein n=1 Tax=Liparis tanakae TaxID=230148 RepID=A0A4Z2FP49_9TELE|nr:hypothetical protein EYF80_046803 [Liparis tanakae]
MEFCVLVALSAANLLDRSSAISLTPGTHRGINPLSKGNKARGPGALLHTLRKVQRAVVGTVVQLCQLSQRQDGLKRSTDGVDTGSLPGVGQKPPGLLDGFDLWETARAEVWGSREKAWWLGEWLWLLLDDVDRGKVERRPSLSLLDRGWEMAVGQWEISEFENGEAGNWDSLEVMAGTLMPILMSMAPL